VPSDTLRLVAAAVGRKLAKSSKPNPSPGPNMSPPRPSAGQPADLPSLEGAPKPPTPGGGGPLGGGQGGGGGEPPPPAPESQGGPPAPAPVTPPKTDAEVPRKKKWADLSILAARVHAAWNNLNQARSGGKEVFPTLYFYLVEYRKAILEFLDLGKAYLEDPEGGFWVSTEVLLEYGDGAARRSANEWQNEQGLRESLDALDQATRLYEGSSQAIQEVLSDHGLLGEYKEPPAPPIGLSDAVDQFNTQVPPPPSPEASPEVGPDQEQPPIDAQPAQQDTTVVPQTVPDDGTGGGVA